MTVRELIDVCTCDIWITLGEDPSNCHPDIKISVNNSDDDIKDLLSNDILDHEIYLMLGLDEIIYVSLFLANDKI